MGYGIIIKNSNNEIQIDGQYRNYCFEQEGTAAFTSSAVVSITSSPLIPLILIRPELNKWGRAFKYAKDADNFVSFGICTEEDVAASIDWKSYRETPNASGETYGLRIYNDSGLLVFDSGKSYFKIMQINDITLTADGTSYTDISHPAVSNPFYLLTNWNLYIAYAGPTPYVHSFIYYIGVKPLTSTSVRVGWFYCGAIPAQVNQTQNPSFKLITCAL